MAEEKYKLVSHRWSPLRGVGKQYCTSCGLVRLNNAISDWCVGRGCEYDLHSQYTSKVKQLTRSKKHEQI